jgi:hypothetical protein
MEAVSTGFSPTRVPAKDVALGAYHTCRSRGGLPMMTVSFAPSHEMVLERKVEWIEEDPIEHPRLR